MLTRRCVESALQSSANEVLVSDDASSLELETLLADLSGDERLRLFTQEKNLGLWENHLFLLQQSRSEWIKFIQTDDYLAHGALEEMLKYTDPNVSLIVALPSYHHLGTDDILIPGQFASQMGVRRFPSDTYLRRLCIRGNEPGRPSYCLYRKDSLDLNPAAWRSDMSSDLVQNVISASRGVTVLLPTGLVFCGVHEQQDIRTQSFELIVKRLINSLTYLRESEYHPGILRFISLYGSVEALGLFFIACKRLLGKTDILPFFYFLQLLQQVQLLTILRHFSTTRDFILFKYFGSKGSS